MRIATIYDIHGNLPALEAVIEEIYQAKADLIVVGGDVIPGPMPRETIAYLQSLRIPVKFIQGNGEAAVLAERRGDSSAVPEQAREAVHWVAQQLDPELERSLAGWPLSLRVQMDGIGDVLFCHATPRNNTEIFTRLTPEERLLSVFAGIHSSVVVCGHTHMQFDRIVGGVRVINAGSVGMPFGEPGAWWLLLGPDIELRRTPYDFAKAADRIRSTKYPQAENFAVHNILEPPAEEQMLEVFARAELK